MAFQGGRASIPHTMLLDRQDRKLAEWSGSVPLDQLERDTAKLFKTPK